MSYYDGSKLALWRYAQEYTLADNFFHGAFGGSFLNHIWLVCACMPKYENAPSELVAQLGSDGKLVKDGAITPEGWAVNTIQSVYQPHSATIMDTKKLLPPQTQPTIGDRLSEKKISWAYYSGGWNDAMAGKPARPFPVPPSAVRVLSAVRGRHGRQDRAPEGRCGLLHGGRQRHPAGGRVLQTARGREHAPRLRRRGRGRQGDREGGGEGAEQPDCLEQLSDYRHLRRERRPLGPRRSAQGRPVRAWHTHPGGDHLAVREARLRRPPFYDTTSILKFIETRFDLAPLSEREAKVGDLTNAFAFY